MQPETEARVDNQHKKITGYRDLTQAEIDVMNEIKAHEKATAELHRKVVALIGPPSNEDRYDSEISERRRNAALARTEFETGFMRLVRSVARPISPWI